MSDRIAVTYRVRSDAASIAARARTIAVEQSVEMPLEAIDDPTVLHEIVGEVQSIDDLGNGVFAVRIGLAAATIENDAGQLLNMLFGNTSLHEDVVLHDVALPASFPGPRHGVAGLRARVAAFGRALTCSALKPQGLSPERLADLAERFARGGIDYIKDDHGLADQSYSRFADRVRACADGVVRAMQASGHPTHYLPSLSGDLDAMRDQAAIARDLGLDCLLIAPVIAGFSNMQALVREFPDMAFFAHPAMGGAARIASELLIGKLFPMLGADAVIFPSYGGRFGYTLETCGRLADNARGGSCPAMPVPAGGMTLERTPELLDFYGPDAMLLIGGSLLSTRERLTQATASFTRAVAQHKYR
jgi:ribulose-bisphosphate carboxylase large chain